MAVSAINNLGVNNRVSFKNEEPEKKDDVQKRHSYNFRNHFVNSKDIKEPVVVAGTLVGAALLSYLSVQCIATGILSRFAPNLSTKVETGLRNTANKVKENSQKWAETKPEGVVSKMKYYTGKAVGKVEAGARKLYKGIAYIGLPETMQGKERTCNAFGNIAGTAAFGITLNQLCTKDSDGDGIKDILQKSKN